MIEDLFDKKIEKDIILDAPSYEVFHEALQTSGCDKCALHASRTQIVVDRGNPKAKVLMIGEAPGQHEDLEGKAFVGRSGKLLDAMLKDQGFETNQDALIANVVKCRPPQNRAPKPLEVKTCRPYLDKQIALVNPAVILLLGAVALRHVLADRKAFSMAEEAGRFFEDHRFAKTRLMVLFHPAYILRDPRKKPLMEAHLKSFVEYWRMSGLPKFTRNSQP